MSATLRLTVGFLWKTYFFVLMFLNSPNYLLQSYDRVWESVDALFFIVSLIGLFGKIWLRRFIGIRFWQIFVPCFIVWNISYHYFISLSEQHAFIVKVTGISPNNVTTLMLLALLPALNALWVYAYENRGLWHPYVYTRSSFEQKATAEAGHP